jgi:Uncharacterized protein conserved in bacteria (DUF2252)
MNSTQKALGRGPDSDPWSGRTAAATLAPGQEAADLPTQVPGAAAATNSNGPTVPAAALLAAGKALRERIPRQIHGSWKRDKQKVDPLAILRASNRGRIDQLIPIRHARMLQSPFTFYRGAAAVMAADLALRSL